MRTHVLPQLPSSSCCVMLMDGASSHWNPRLLLEARRDLYQPGALPILLFTYPPNLSRLVAPPDDHAVFGAFQRTRRQELSQIHGPQNRIELMRTAGVAFSRNFTQTDADPLRFCQPRLHC